MHRRIIQLVLAALVLAAATPLEAQYYFGKNKVQYTHFDWQVMTTEHFHIYFYKEEAEVAKIAAEIAESGYRLMAIRFNQEVKDKIPLIIFFADLFCADQRCTGAAAGVGRWLHRVS